MRADFILEQSYQWCHMEVHAVLCLPKWFESCVFKAAKAKTDYEYLEKKMS